MPLSRCRPSMAIALVRAAVIDSKTAVLLRPATWKCGDWIRATPQTPQAAAAQTAGAGALPSIGQDSSATQIGNVLVSVSTSEVGRWANAKKVQSRLMLLAQPRSQRA